MAGEKSNIEEPVASSQLGDGYVVELKLTAMQIIYISAAWGIIVLAMVIGPRLVG